MNATTTFLPTSIVDHSFNFLPPTCELDTLFDVDLVAGNKANLFSMEQSTPFQSVYIFAVLMIGAIISLFYRFFPFKPRGFTFHFLGIRPPKHFNKSHYKLFDNIDTQSSMVTAPSSLTPTDTIRDLKNLIKKTFEIEYLTNDILIMYAHHVISHNNDAKLSDFALKDNSLITLAICNTEQHPMLRREAEAEMIDSYDRCRERVGRDIDIDDIETKERAKTLNAVFEMHSDDDSDSDDDDDDDDDGKDDEKWNDEQKLSEEQLSGLMPLKGFDIVTQEHDVDVFRMPHCGHLMSAESLYHYALNVYKEPSSTKLKCPHLNNKCDARWDYNSIVHILQHEHEYDAQAPRRNNYVAEDQWLSLAKLELLASRNRMQNECDVQKCPFCATVYFKSNEGDKTNADVVRGGGRKKKLAFNETEVKVDEMEKEFRTECVLCNGNARPMTDYQKWRVGDHCEIVAKLNSKRQWVKGQIAAKFEFKSDSDCDDKAPEMLVVSYNNGELSQECESNSEFIRKLATDSETGAPIVASDAFCWCCGSQWSEGHFCDSSLRNELIHILKTAETKQIGSVKDVPSIRCCPTCCQLIYHIDACKHVCCKTCKTNFCFVCMKPQIKGRWQCGCSSDVCPVHPPQDMKTLPDVTIIAKKTFQLFD